MELLLFRHGEAIESAPGLGDQGRWLTEKGRRTTRKVARFLDERASRRPATVWTSSLVRAVQTAEILAATIGVKGEVVVQPDLAPNGDPAELVRIVATFRGRGPLAIVGHEPSLSLIARHLLGDVPWPGLKKSGVAAIGLSASQEDGGALEATFRWLLRPKGMEVVRTLEPLPVEAVAPA